MKKEFAVTDNYKRFVAALSAILSAPSGVDRMGLIYGDPGLGKTESAIKWVNDFGSGAVYVRTKKLMTGPWLLGEIVSELGESPAYRTQDLFKQAEEVLRGTDRVVILDEVDYLAHDARVIETIRDIHDMTNSPFIFIGMDQADKKLKRFRHLWRRFSQVVKYEPLGRHDIENVLNQICEVGVDDLIIDYICSSGELTVAVLYRWTMRIEQIGKRAGKDKITIDDMKSGKKK
jgi:Cdc6-like AAA superfamily ATPase